MKKHRLGIILVFCILLTILVLEICALVQSKWWTCDLSAQVPILNLTAHRKSVMVSLKMRTSLSDSCWHLETVPGPVQRKLFLSPSITKCLLKDFKAMNFTQMLNSTNSSLLTENLEEAVQESRSGLRNIQTSLIVCLIFLGVGLIIGLINIIVCNGCMLLSNLILIFSSAICMIASVIYSIKTIDKDAKFDIYNRELIPSLLIWSDMVTAKGKDLLESLFGRLDKVQVLRHQCVHGQTFTINWLCLVLISIAFFVSILSHILGVRSNDSKYKEPIYSGDNGRSGFIGSPSFADLDDDD